MKRAGTSGLIAITALLVVTATAPPSGQTPPPPTSPDAKASSTTPADADPRLAKLKQALAADIKSTAMFDLGQQMNDMVFSFGELGFQEFETQKYLTGILKANGFTIESGIAGIPSAWVAK